MSKKIKLLLVALLIAALPAMACGAGDDDPFGSPSFGDAQSSRRVTPGGDALGLAHTFWSLQTDAQ